MSIEASNSAQDTRIDLCRYIRSPDETSKLKHHETRRLAIYRRLFFGNITNFINQTFPLLSGYYSDASWEVLIQGFVRDHCCQTPYFREIGREFLLYLEHEYQYDDKDQPFMLDLAHYEWALLNIEFAAQEISEEGIDPKGDFLSGRLQLSPLLCSLRYRYPVQTITKEAKTVEYTSSGVYLMMNRDREYKVKILEGNPVTARILAHAAVEHESGEQILRAIAHELGRKDVDAIISHGITFLEQLRDADMVLGTF